MSIIIHIIQTVIILVIAYIAKSYLQEKGKNLATKEDIAEITTRIEHVKHEYSSKLESVKSVLNARLFTHQVRYQNEFNILLNLSEKLAEFRNNLSNLEIQGALLSTSRGNANDAKETAKKVLASMEALWREYEAHLPFYPEDIYENVRKLHGLSWRKLVVQLDKANLTETNTAVEAIIEMVSREVQSSDDEAIPKITDEIYKAIRKRVKYWEELNI